MSKIKSFIVDNKKELAGSAGIALSLYMGSLMLQHLDSMEKANASAQAYQRASEAAAESGDMGMARGSAQSGEDPRKEAKRQLNNAGGFGALGGLALGVGLGALGSRAKEDSRQRMEQQAARIPGPAELPPVEPQPAQASPVEPAQFDDRTQRIERITIPVPRSEPPVLQKR